MNRITTVSTKGQLVIPAEMRESLNIRPGSRIAVTMSGGRIFLVPVSDKLVEETAGMLRGGPSLSAALHEDREQARERENRQERRREKW